MTGELRPGKAVLLPRHGEASDQDRFDRPTRNQEEHEMTRRGYLRLLAAALAAAAMLVAVSAGPPVWAQSGNEAVVSRNFPPSMAQSTEAFWTSERMANALPCRCRRQER
jgi:hypothetical protein